MAKRPGLATATDALASIMRWEMWVCVRMECSKIVIARMFVDLIPDLVIRMVVRDRMAYVSLVTLRGVLAIDLHELR